MIIQITLIFVHSDAFAVLGATVEAHFHDLNLTYGTSFTHLGI